MSAAPENETTHPLPASDRVGLRNSSINEQGAQSVSHDNQWEEKVARGRALVTEINDRKWELGDLANEVCPAGAVGVSDRGRLADFAREIGITDSALEDYRRVAAAWPIPTRVGTQTYTTHKILAARDDRHGIIAEQIWTYNSLSQRLDRLPNPSRAKAESAPMASWSPEQKRQAFRDLSSDETVTDDPAVRIEVESNIRKAREELHRERNQAAERGRKEREVEDSKDAGFYRWMEANGHLVDALKAEKAAGRALRDAIDFLNTRNFRGEQHELLGEALTEIREAIANNLNRAEALAALFTEGSTDWDAALASLTGGDA